MTIAFVDVDNLKKLTIGLAIVKEISCSIG